MSLNYKRTIDELKQRINEMRTDLFSLRYNTEEMKTRYMDIFDASHHLFNAIIANKMDMNMLNLMLNKLGQKMSSIKEEDADNVDREMGKILADKYLYPTIGKQPALSKEKENELIKKVKEENAKSEEKLTKLNSGEMTQEEFHKGKTRIQELDLN